MSKIIPTCILLAVLGACTNEQVIAVVDRPVTIKIDRKLLVCNRVPLPNPDSLLDSEVAITLVTQHTELELCADNVDAIRDLTVSEPKE